MVGRVDRYEAQDTPKFPGSMETTCFPHLRSLSARSVCWPGQMCVTARKAAITFNTRRLHRSCGGGIKPPARALMTRSNLGDMARGRHGDRFDVCLLFSAIRELVSDRPSKFVFPDILAGKKKKKKKRRLGTSQTLNGAKNLAAGDDDKKVLLFSPLRLVKSANPKDVALIIHHRCSSLTATRVEVVTGQRRARMRASAVAPAGRALP